MQCAFVIEQGHALLFCCGWESGEEGGGGLLLLQCEFMRATAAKRKLQLGPACTCEWLQLCWCERRDLPRNRQRHWAMPWDACFVLLMYLRVIRVRRFVLVEDREKFDWDRPNHARYLQNNINRDTSQRISSITSTSPRFAP